MIQTIKFHWKSFHNWLRGGIISLMIWFFLFITFILYRIGFFVFGPCDCINPILYNQEIYCKCNIFSSFIDPFVNGFLKFVVFPGSFIGIITFNIGVIFLIGALIGLLFGKAKVRKLNVSKKKMSKAKVSGNKKKKKGRK